MTKVKLFKIIGILCVVAVNFGLYGCGTEDGVENQLDLADSLMESRPDSALIILDEVEDSELGSRGIKARHALLLSMALDKNGIDTTEFSVLQPAIDHYLKGGNADEKLRTYYYQGRIYENAGMDDQAMQSYMNGLEHTAEISDSLTLARLLVAQGALCFKEYQIEELVANNLKAAGIYRRLDRHSQELKCCLRALQGEVILNNKPEADSIYKICKAIIKDSELLKKRAQSTFLLYALGFGYNEDIRSIIHEIKESGITEDIKMNLANAYTKIGEPTTGLQYLNETKISPDNILDSLTYWSVKTDILEDLGKDGDALEAFRNYSRVLEIYHHQLFSSELLFSEKKHEMEMENLAMLRKRDNAIKWILAGVIMLVIMTALIYYRYRLNRAARLLAESNAEKLKVEGDNQRLRAENLESERARLELEAENLHHKIGELEGEQTRLRELLDSQDTLSEEARELIRKRIAMLNGLIAQALTDQESYGKEFKNYIKKIRKDKKGFQESLVKVLVTTHPAFIAYLKEHGLTDRELHYACLYAIGMRGKEIGTYLDLARHYNISTDIRRKLGLDPNGENLGPFLRNMMER